MNRLAEEALGTGNAAAKARVELKLRLSLDELNFAYFMALYRMKHLGRTADRVVIHEDGQPTGAHAVAYPTAIASPEMLKDLPLVSHGELKGEPSTGAVLWIKKMHAGTGSAMIRRTYLAKYQGVDAKKVRLGAKGTDLFVPVPGAGEVRLAEVQIAQLLLAAKRGEFGGVLFHDIVGTETQTALESVWNRPSLLDPKRTYAQTVATTPGVGRFGTTFQSHLPTLNREGQLTTNRVAPGGHALFAVDAIRAAFVPGGIPDTEGKPLVAAIGNGEDLGSTPSRQMVDWMVRNQIPIVMVTTEKTGVDLQGGQIAIVQPKEGNRFVTLIETAQAKESGQLELFQRLGLDVKRGNQIAYFNTNLALFNYGALVPRLRRLLDEIGEEALMGVLMPDLIDKWKSQTDADGVDREYLQLEGAMGSTLLNLDRFWRSRYGEPLVHFINVSKEERTDFFSPIKNGFDFFLQFHSDRFRLDRETLRLVNARPGAIPFVRFVPPAGQEKYWDDLSTVLEAFAGASSLDLDSLTVHGPLRVSHAVLKGKVVLRHEGPRPVDLCALGGTTELHNVEMSVSADGKLATRKF